MIRFDTRDVKPKVWNIAVLSAVTAAAAGFLAAGEDPALPALSVLLCVYLAVTIILLVSAFVRQLQYNPYSYNTIYYSAFALFLTFTLIEQSFICRSILRLRLNGTREMLRMLSILLGSAQTFMLISLPFILVFSVCLCVSNVSLIRHEGKRPVNLLGILLSFLMLGGEAYLFMSDYYASGSLREIMLHNLRTNLFAALYLYCECMLIGTIIANLIVIRYRHDHNKDVIIILGCGLREDGTPTPLLAGRIDGALRFRQEQIDDTGKVPLLIASGGQGRDEVNPESTAIRRYLIERGIPAEEIVEESRSTDTFENMKYSKEIADRLRPGGKVLVCTTNYHVFRSGLLARRVKMRAVSTGSKTKWYFWPNATVREFAGIMTEHRLKQALILGGMILLYAVTTWLYYLYF